MSAGQGSEAEQKAVRVGGRRSGAWLARYALEQLPVSHTFGIPGVHNTELYDELGRSSKIRPVLVTHEGGGAFAADALSRTGGGRIGCLVIVPAAGLTHAMSGIAEAYFAGIPLLVISAGIRINERFGFQIHNVDQQRLAEPVVKRAWKITEHRQIVPTIFEAYRTAIRGVPGPVLVEIPANIQLLQAAVEEPPVFADSQTSKTDSSGAPPSLDKELDEAVRLLTEARAPGIFVGWGAVGVSAAVAEIAEMLGAPVSTTLQGMSAFPGNHPLHTGMGFSQAAVPAAENAFRECDCLLAIGTRFGEIPTGSFSCRVPESLIHIDIAPEAIGRNFPAKVGIVGDSRVVVPELMKSLRASCVIEKTPRPSQNRAGTGHPQDSQDSDNNSCPQGASHNLVDFAARRERVAKQIAADKQSYREEWRAHRTERVNPALLFEELRQQLGDDAIITVDDGNHTFLAAELFEVRCPRTFLSPTDFNCMGYAVPAAIGAKLANPERQVAAIVGDGAFLMTGIEIVTASTLHLGIAYFVFHDQALSQISQGQELMYNRKTCTTLAEFKLSGMAEAVGARYLAMENNGAIAHAVHEALASAARGEPVIVDVIIDYSKRTRFTQGVVRARMNRFPLADRLRFIGRALWRKITG